MPGFQVRVVSAPPSPTTTEVPARTMLAGAAHIMTGRVSTMAVQFLSLVIIGRMLGPATFGVLQFTVAVFVYLGLFADLGLSIVGTRQVARDGAESSSHVLTARLFQGGLIATVALLLAVLLPLRPQEREVVLILTIGLLATAFNLRWFLQGSERFRAIAIADTVSALLQLAAAFTLIRGSGDLIQAAIVVVIAPIANTVLTWALARGMFRFRPRMGRPILRLVAMAVPLGIAVTATQVYYGADSILIGLQRSSTEVGLYSAAYRIVLACLTIPFAIHAVMLPLLARVEADDEAWSVITLMTRWLLVLALPIAIGTTLTAPTIVVVVFGPDYVEAAQPLAILIWSCVTVSANAAFGAHLLARGRDRSYVTITLLACALNVGLNLVIIPVYGMVGAAAVTLMTEVVVLALIARAVGHGAGAAMLAAGRPVLLPAMVMGLVVLPVREEPLAIPLGIVTYIVVAFVSGVLPRTMVRDLLATIRGAGRRGSVS